MRYAVRGAIAATVLIGSSLIIGTASAKTVKECNEEYAANKAAIQGAGQKKKDFITACRAGTETIPGAAAAPTSAAPVFPAPAPTAAPAAPTSPATVPTARRAPAAPSRAPGAGTPSAANQFSTDSQAKAKCPGDTVVWVNIKSRVYHFAGHRDYGNTKSGAYMCEADATAAGNRAPKNEKHP